MIMEQATNRKSLFLQILKQPMALLGGSIILLWFLLGVFAYLIIPDKTPDANRQIPEIQNAPAGSVQLFFKKPTEKGVTENTFSWWSGRADRVEFIPIKSYTIKGDTLNLQKHVEEDSFILQRYRLHEAGAGRSEKEMFERKKFILGTDQLGRDILSRLLVGTRVTLSVGIIAVFISVLLGTLLGMIAGYMGGRTDNWILYLMNVAWSIPTLLLVFGITMAIGKGMIQIYVAVGLTMWVSVARLVRSEVLLLRNMEYVQAAQLLGIGHVRILWKHILPNLTGILVVTAASNFASAIMIEAGLSFLGLGVQPPVPGWGLMMRENYTYLITGHAIAAIAPGIAMCSLVGAFYALSNGLRNVFDVRQRIN